MSISVKQDRYLYGVKAIKHTRRIISKSLGCDAKQSGADNPPST